MSGSGIDTVAIIGAGVMGRGIAQLALTAGKSVLLFDTSDEVRSAAQAEIGSRIRRLAEKGALTAGAAEGALNRLDCVGSAAQLGNADLVVEAIVEDLGIKQRVLAEAETHLASDALIATNTSSLLVSAIAAGVRDPSRVVGLHFFNPAPLMRLVEVIAGAATAPAAVDRVTVFAGELGRVPVAAADTGGFIVNRLGRGYVLEAARMAQAGVGDFRSIDRMLTGAMGFRMGPFALMDLTGLDVTYPASRAIWESNGFDSRLVPPALLERRLMAGHLGRKSGRGFHVGHDDPEPLPEERPQALALWCFDTRAMAGPLEALSSLGIETAEKAERADLLLIPAIGNRVLAAAAELGLDPSRTIGVDAVFSSPDHVALTVTALTKPSLCAALGHPSISLQFDSAGTVCQRVALQLALIGGDMVTEGVATETDIDTAARLALGHPEGPLARIRRLGPASMEHLRRAIFAATGDDRFRPSPWLTDAALQEVLT